MTTLTFTTANGVFMAVQVWPTDKLWVNHRSSPRPKVSFFDTRYGNPPGQLIATYYLDTLLQRSLYGLSLNGGIPEWDLSSTDFSKVQAWLVEEAKKLP